MKQITYIILVLAALAGMFSFRKTTAATPVDTTNDLNFRGATGWLNSRPLTPSDLRGKVVLVQFWTYTCINWMRTLPYTRAWAEKYKDRGLQVVSVHTPEFSFEENSDNVQKAIHAMNISYPVALDNDRAIWHAFDNNYWPALYLIDAKGKIRHRQFGEGEYEKTEKTIRQLLAETGKTDLPTDLVSPSPDGPEVAADWQHLRSGENYLGEDRTTGFIPGSYDLQLNQWTLAGPWTSTGEYISLQQPGGTIRYRFHARDLHMVMGPATSGQPIRFRILLDGKIPGNAHGTDTDAQGNGIITGQKLYQLIRHTDSITDQTFEIEFLDPGVQAFSFTFG